MVIGRKNEIGILNNALHDKKSHFITIYGRRRVGKTFLINEAFDNRFCFQHTGLANSGMKEQLEAFSLSLNKYGYASKKKPKNWLSAFDSLQNLISQSTEKRKIIFIDELSWMDTPKSDFLPALENFWNGFAYARKDIVLIVCASATSWMLKKIIHNKGGLYNRLTDHIHLDVFTLGECEEFVRSKQIALNRDQILQFYMIFGGVPYYWEFLEKGLSLPQNIDKILFDKNSPLKNEFQHLYASVFNNPEEYINIIEALGSKKSGMTRDEIISAANVHNSGTLSVRLEELESCGFIRKYSAFGMKKKSALYQLIDNFTLFYYKFLKSEPTDEHFFTNQINTPAINTWMGLAFELVCLQHIKQIKNKLGISGVLTDINSWHCKANADKGVFGSQIDLLIVRKDQIINLCEMKYSGSEYTVTNKTDLDIRHKISDFTTLTGTKHAIHPTLITTYGIVENSYSYNIQSVVTMEDLFID